MTAESAARSTIARGSAGDCCILCGRVGMNLPEDHQCQPDIVVKTSKGDGWNALFAPRSIALRSTAAAGTPTAPTAPGSPRARLQGLLRTVQRASVGQRNSTLFWASCRVGEMVAAGEIVDVTAAAQALAEAAAVAGLDGPEVLSTISSGLERAGVAR